MKLYIVSHKHLDLTIPDSYQPIFAGAMKCPLTDRRGEWMYDDSGEDTISFKNPSFCELTALYWIWKNDTSDITGLLHYRRYARRAESASPLSEEEVETILAEHDCIVARRAYQFNPIDNRLCSIAEQYRIIHSSTDLVLVDRVLKHCFKPYHAAFRRCIARNYLHPCNVIICRRELLDAYCRWLFSVESAMEQCINPYENRDVYQRRVFGFLAERLLNVYIEAHRLDVFEASLFDPAHPKEELIYLPKVEDLRPTFDIAQPKQPPIAHGRDYSSVFDYRFYLKHHVDLITMSIPNQDTALWHFLEHGIKERRMAHPCFSIASYMSGHPELRDVCGDDPRRYLEFYLEHRDCDGHRVGFENLILTDKNRGADAAHSPDPDKKTCLGKKIRLRILKRRFRQAELLPVLD